MQCIVRCAAHNQVEPLAGKRDDGVTNWFIQIDADQNDLGPLRPSELLDRVRAGEVTRETMLRMDDGKWFAAGSVGGLFEAAMRPTIEYICPQCEAQIGEPPVACSKCGCDVQQAVTRITENTIVTAEHGPHPDRTGGSAPSWQQRKDAKRNSNDPESLEQE